MEIEKLRMLWYLSTVPTHSKASLTELHQLVREAAPELVSSKYVVCDLCRNHEDCINKGTLAAVCVMGEPKFANFELRMEDNEQ